MRINPIGVCAAEISDIDCSMPLTENQFRTVKEAYLAYPVLIFRDQRLTPPQIAEFGRRFGELESYALSPAQAKPNTAAIREKGARETPDQNLYVCPDDVHVVEMTNEVKPGQAPIGVVDNAEVWHSDGSHKAEPYQAIAIHVIRNPAHGGDTEFCDLRLLYDAFTPGIRRMLDGRTAIHQWSKSRNARFAAVLDEREKAQGERIAQMVPDMPQPVVRTHPETGRRSLYLSPRFTLRLDGVTPEQSDMLLDSIFKLMDEPRFCYRHEWREKDLVIWDNRCLNHRVRSYPAADIRSRLRISVAGDKPFFRAA